MVTLSSDSSGSPTTPEIASFVSRSFIAAMRVIGNDRLQYFSKFGFGSVTVFKILRKSVTVRLRFFSKLQTSVTVRFRFTSCKKPRFRFRLRLVKIPGFWFGSVSVNCHDIKNQREHAYMFPFCLAFANI